jgi:predicted phosphodiesterase
MRVLVLSDIHANLAALEAVLEDAAQQDYEAVWCLGDIVGYGPEPDACVTRIRLLRAVTVVGNHDWAVVGRMDVGDFNPEARRAVLWTREHVSGENLAWLGALPSRPLVQGEYTLTHGSPRDPVWEYVLFPSAARANLEVISTPFCLVGHTHVPAVYVWPQGAPSAGALTLTPGQAVALHADWRAILNPGSVGQPRDNNPRAAYAILDTEDATWLPLRVPYHVEVTQAHMRAARLPERLINRLSVGW